MNPSLRVRSINTPQCLGILIFTQGLLEDLRHQYYLFLLPLSQRIESSNWESQIQCSTCTHTVGNVSWLEKDHCMIALHFSVTWMTRHRRAREGASRGRGTLYRWAGRGCWTSSTHDTIRISLSEYTLILWLGIKTHGSNSASSILRCTTRSS